MCKKELFVLGAAVVMAVMVVMSLPVMGTAGGVEIPPAWSQKLEASKRFVLVLDNLAVLDNETGLVWEQSPSTSLFTWTTGGVVDHCYRLEIGGRKGWHIPTIEQLATLVDTSAVGSPKLPSGHPFTNVQSAIYWSATPPTGGEWFVNFSDGEVLSNVSANSFFVWCVRGGQSYDAH